MTKGQRTAIGIGFVYFGLALVCLRQWGSPQPWAGIDIFAGGFLGLMFLSMLHELFFGLTTLRSSEALREAIGTAYDKATILVMPVVAVGDFLVFLDYGHWHLIPALRGVVIQGIGLVLGIIASSWVSWTDACLARHFAAPPAQRRVMQEGPFRYVRHPRYAGILAVRGAFALVFASPIGWLLVLAYAIVLLRRIRLEEGYLQRQFGREYESYAHHTPRLFPGVY